MTVGASESSPRVKVRLAGIFYALTFLTGGTALLAGGRLGMAAGLTAGVCYVFVTLLFYEIFKPVNRNLSLLAAIVSLAGCVIGPLSAFHIVPFQINSLVFFGVYCLLIGCLVFKSTFLPRTLGVLMALGGLGWLTFVSSSLSKDLFPYNLAPGIFGEGVLTVWLLVRGVNIESWKALASGASARSV